MLHNRKRIRHIMRCTGLLLILVMTMVACGKKEAPEDLLQYVYTAMKITIPDDGYAFPANETISWNGENCTVTAYRKDEYGLASADRKVYTFTPDEPVLVAQATNDGMQDTGVQTFALPQGEKLVTETKALEGERFTLLLSVLDEEGTSLFQMDITEPFSFDYTRVLHGDGVFRLLDVVQTDTTEGWLYLVLTTEGLCALSETGQVCWYSTREDRPLALLETAGGILYLYADREGQILSVVDPVLGEWEEDFPLPDVLSVNSGTFLSGGETEYDMYVQNSLGLWGVLFSIDEEGNRVCTPEKLIDWSVSALTYTEIKHICIITPELMAVMMVDALDSGVTGDVYLLSHVPRELVEEKQTITLATLAENTMLNRAVAAFNRENDTYRISVRSYTQYDREQGKTFLDADMAAGYVPDMVYIFDNSSGIVDGYERNGLFTDLTPLLAADKELSADLLGYVTKPYIRAGGKQYVFPMMLYYDTKWGPVSTFDGPVSVEKMVELYDTISSPAMLTGSEFSAYIYMVQGMFMRFVDWEKGVCHFDDPLFLSTLEKILPHQSTQNEKNPIIQSPYWQDGVYGWTMHRLEQGEDLIPIGWPGDGEKLMAMDGYEFLGITEVSPYKEQCMTLLKYYIDTQGEHTNNWITRSQVYDSLTAYEGVTIYLTPDGPKQIEDNWLAEEGMYEYLVSINSPVLADISCESYKLTKSDADAFIAYLDDIDSILLRNTPLYNIYWEECMQTENRSAAEIAEAIQSRGSLYMDEVYG